MRHYIAALVQSLLSIFRRFSVALHLVHPEETEEMYPYYSRHPHGPRVPYPSYQEREVDGLVVYINSIVPPPPGAQGGGAAQEAEFPEAAPFHSVAGNILGSDNTVPSDVNSKGQLQPESSQSAPSSENASSGNAALVQSQTGNDINTSLASQFANTSVTPPLVEGPEQMEASGSAQNSGIVSDLAESESRQTGSRPSVVVSDIVEAEGRPAVPRVIARDIVDLGNGQSVVMPNEADLQQLDEAGKTGQKRKAEEENGSGEENVHSPKEQKRVGEGGDEEEEAVNRAEEPSAEEAERERTIREILRLMNIHKPGGPPATLEQQMRQLTRSSLEYVLSGMNAVEQWQNTGASDYPDEYDLMYHPAMYYPVYGRRRGRNYRRLSDEDSDDEGSFSEAFKHPPEPAKFALTSEQRLTRVLIFGGVSRVQARHVDPEKIGMADLINSMIEEGIGEHVVNTLREISVSGRSNRQDNLLYALSRCCRSTDMKTKHAAYAALQDICRIPTHIFQLIAYIESAGTSSGWGRGLRHALVKWYNKNADNPLYLAMHITKYWSRHGWNHRDIFRLAHIKPVNDTIGFLVRYAVKGMKEAEDEFLQDGYLERTQLEKVHKYLKAVEEAKSCQDVARTTELIQEHNLVREQLATQMLNQPAIWSLMLPNMPLNALLRNINKMTAIDLFSDAENLKTVTSKFLNMTAMRKAKVHPLRILLAHRMYQKGSGEKGSLSWTPNAEIVAALEKAFYGTFDDVQPTNKRILIALDISSSMGGLMGDYPISVREAATVMAMVTIKREAHCDIVGFHDRLMPLDMFRDTTKRLEQLIEETSALGFGSTDCSKPMVWARKHRKEYDAFIIYTDSETNVHRIPPYMALNKYRQEMNIPTAKLVVVGMSSSNFSIAHPDDMYMLDVVGFDPECPEMIREFLMEGAV